MKTQLDFFGVPESGIVPLEAPPLRPEHLTLAAKLPADLRLGTQSWSYPGWAGILYPAGAKEKQLAERGLTAYARNPLLRTVEIDRTYYEPITAQTYSGYASQVPEDFRFAAKAPEACTVAVFPDHARYGAVRGQRNPRLFDAGYATDQVVAPFVTGLGLKTGPLIFQFPPQKVTYPERFAERLHDFLRRLPRGPTYAVEVRNPVLLTREYGAALVAAGAMHCHNAWGMMPPVAEQALFLPPETRKTLVVRWLMRLGDNYEAARERYQPFDRIVEEDPAALSDIVERVEEAAPRCVPAFVLVSNKAEGCAPQSVFRLADSVVARLNGSARP